MILDFYFQVRSFLNIYDLVDENYVMYSQHEEDDADYNFPPISLLQDPAPQGKVATRRQLDQIADKIDNKIE